MIVHQAPVNHGDSGGPLLNANGEVIGINTLTNEGQAQGQYYAIGINYAERLLPSLEAGKSHLYLGWDLEQINGQDPHLKEQLAPRFEQSAYSNDAAHLTEITAAYLAANPPTVAMYDVGDTPEHAGSRRRARRQGDPRDQQVARELGSGRLQHPREHQPREEALGRRAPRHLGRRHQTDHRRRSTEAVHLRHRTDDAQGIVADARLDRLAGVVAHRFDDRPEPLPASCEHVDDGRRA